MCESNVLLQFCLAHTAWDQPGGLVFIGGTDGTDEVWRWERGDVIMPYHNFLPPEPNNGAGQHCLTIQLEGVWIDTNCDYQAWFICEYS